jgi:hypothetical protein
MLERNMAGLCVYCGADLKTSRALKVHQLRSRLCPGPLGDPVGAQDPLPVQDAAPLIPDAASLFPDAASLFPSVVAPLSDDPNDAGEFFPSLDRTGPDVGVGRKRNAASRSSSDSEVHGDTKFESAWELFLAFSWCNNGQGLCKRDFHAIFSVFADYRYTHQELLAFESAAAFEEWGHARLAADDPGWRDTVVGHPKCPDLPFRTCDTEKVKVTRFWYASVLTLTIIT